MTEEYFMFSKTFGPSLSPTRLIIHLVPKALSAGVKRRRCEVKNDWRHSISPPYAFVAFPGTSIFSCKGIFHSNEYFTFLAVPFLAQFFSS